MHCGCKAADILRVAMYTGVQDAVYAQVAAWIVPKAYASNTYIACTVTTVRWSVLADDMCRLSCHTVIFIVTGFSVALTTDEVL